MSRAAIADIKSLDRKDPRFLQMMLVKLTTHKNNLELSSMGHRITSDEMVREEWLPMLTEGAKEDWLKVPCRSSPIWNHFERFLQEQSQACKHHLKLSKRSAVGARYEGTRLTHALPSSAKHAEAGNARKEITGSSNSHHRMRRNNHTVISVMITIHLGSTR